MLWTLALVVIAAGYGAAAGALLPRAAYRFAVPAGEDRRTHCPEGHPLGGPANGWLGSARCKHCTPSTPPPPGAALLPALTATTCAALALTTGPRPELVAWLLAAPPAVLLAAVDWRVRRLPDALTLPYAAGLALLLGAAALLPGAGGDWVRALLGGLALAACYVVLFLINPRGIGFGDVKLAAPVGVALGWYGWQVLFAGVFLGFLLAAVYGLALIAARRAGRKSEVPFGPFMLLGGLGGVLLGGLAA
ncbi:A24 family peptidase [Streptomyces sp. ODS28]|uniref:A24 family peptidase n=1 Tax=Streptomyces sp. ODS28 TaxID=3136688 RepID=UPI0031F1612B